MQRNDTNELWYSANLDVFLNRWFTDYDEARRTLDAEGGFLLPYRRHFYVCEREAVRALGLDPEDPDWLLVGRDAARPADEQAFGRLREKRERAARGL